MNFFDITRGISQAENDILSAILDGKDQFRRSECFWRASFEKDVASEESTLLLDVLSSRLDVISQCIERTEAAAEDNLLVLDELLHGLEIADSEETQTVSPSSWLLDNLHNPYPSSATKATMEPSPELDGRPVNEWFVRARQRIGWTRLLRDRFGGCRTAATDAAFRAFVREDPRSPLDRELRAAFVAVKSHAELVYGSASTESYPPAHPTPVSSRSQSPVPSLTHSSDSEDGTDELQFSKKRKRTYTDPTHPSPSRKRRFTLSPDRSTLHQLPSPLSPVGDDTSPSCSRKRRLSESNPDAPAAKKPRSLDWAPRKQTVSDPLPLPAASFDWESWCNGAFTLPSSATTNNPVPDALDFELFNFDAFPSQPTRTIDSPADARQTLPEQSDAWLDSLFGSPGQTEKNLWATSWESFFNFEFSCHSSPLPSLTSSPSPSSPDTHWSLSPSELPSFESFESPLFDFSSPSLFKIPTLYPTDNVEIVDNSPLIS